jgi:hypothetical protein
MTAQIAIMNKEAIALASDSAATTTGESGQKIFTSANKLFALSKYHPVGIMVYGSANLMDVPWETIIKIYREKELGKKAFKTLQEYASDFIAFLDNGNPLFPDSVQQDYLRTSIYSYFNFVGKEIRDKVQLEIGEKGEITDKAVKQIVSGAIKEHYVKWVRTKNIPSIPKSFNKDIMTKYGEIIDKAIEESFEKLPISKTSSNRLRKIAASLFSKFPEGIIREAVSGVIISGFGENSTFPSFESFDIEGIVNNKMKYRKRHSTEINFERSASVIAFAQKEMVATFMEGIDPYLENHMEGYLSEIFNAYPGIIAESIEKLTHDEKQLLKRKLKEVSNKIFDDFKKEVQTYRKENYVDPVTSVVALLPKDELAAMAETLVNLTVFKRKVTLESETVGGPIDVAVISKGDGFVWIKRKHYFKAELNPQFFANYYQGVMKWTKIKRKNRYTGR